MWAKKIKYTYLIDCFKNSEIEHGERIINGIGDVEDA